MRRILGDEVEPLFPESGPVKFFFFGEAPGPRGADKSGIPFWGDEAGKRLYMALARLGLAEVPELAFSKWNGLDLKQADLKPRLLKAAISNAYNICPTLDGKKFHRPTVVQLRTQCERVKAELKRAVELSGGGLKVIAVGRVAETHLRWIKSNPGCVDFDPLPLPHPSTQGLLSMVNQRGKGCKIADLEKEWSDRLERLLF